LSQLSKEIPDAAPTGGARGNSRVDKSRSAPTRNVQVSSVSQNVRFARAIEGESGELCVGRVLIAIAAPHAGARLGRLEASAMQDLQQAFYQQFGSGRPLEDPLRRQEGVRVSHLQGELRPRAQAKAARAQTLREQHVLVPPLHQGVQEVQHHPEAHQGVPLRPEALVSALRQDVPDSGQAEDAPAAPLRPQRVPVRRLRQAVQAQGQAEGALQADALGGARERRAPPPEARLAATEEAESEDGAHRLPPLHLQVPHVSGGLQEARHAGQSPRQEASGHQSRLGPRAQPPDLADHQGLLLSALRQGLQEQLEAEGPHLEEPPGGGAAHEQQAARELRRRLRSPQPHLLADGGEHHDEAPELQVVPQAVRQQGQAAAAPAEETQRTDGTTERKRGEGRGGGGTEVHAAAREPTSRRSSTGGFQGEWIVQSAVRK
jgi:hypothetical protein